MDALIITTTDRRIWKEGEWKEKQEEKAAEGRLTGKKRWCRVQSRRFK